MNRRNISRRLMNSARRASLIAKGRKANVVISAVKKPVIGGVITTKRQVLQLLAQGVITREQAKVVIADLSRARLNKRVVTIKDVIASCLMEGKQKKKVKDLPVGLKGIRIKGVIDPDIAIKPGRGGRMSPPRIGGAFGRGYPGVDSFGDRFGHPGDSVKSACVIGSGDISGACSGLIENTDIVEYIQDYVSTPNIPAVKADFPEMNLKSETAPDLYLEIARGFYMRFKGADYDNIHYNRTSLMIYGKKPENDFGLQYSGLNAGMLLLSLYSLHVSLRHKWDDGDAIKAERLANHIAENYPTRATKLAEIKNKMEKQDTREFKAKKPAVTKHCAEPDEAPDDFKKMTGLSEFFIAKMHENRNMQYAFKEFILNHAIPHIYEKAGEKWNWCHVRAAMLEKNLFCKKNGKYISGLKFARCIYDFLPESFKNPKVMNENGEFDEEKYKSFISQIKSRTDRNYKDFIKEDDVEYRHVKSIIEILDGYGL